MNARLLLPAILVVGVAGCTGTIDAPDHHDGLIMNGPLLEAMLDRRGAP